MQKPKSFRPWQLDQTTLLPPSPREWLAEDHQVYFLLDLVEELDLSEILIPPVEGKIGQGQRGFWTGPDLRETPCNTEFNYCTECTGDGPRKAAGASFHVFCLLAPASHQQSTRQGVAIGVSEYSAQPGMNVQEAVRLSSGLLRLGVELSFSGSPK